MIPYTRFYKTTGVRLGRQLRDPNLNLLRQFAFPKNAYFHFTKQDLNQDVLQLGIEMDDPFLANIEKSSRVVIFHNTEYDPSIDLKNERLVKHNIQKPLLIKDYHRTHPNFVKGFIDTGKANLITNVSVKNHVLIGADCNYVKTVLSEYNRMRNYWKSVFLDVGKTILTNTREHFVAIPLPALIPSRSQLLKWETESKQNHAKKFNQEERFLFAEFYAWIKEDSNSVFPLEPKVIERLNIIFYYKSVYFVVNLAELRKYIIPEVGKTTTDQFIDQDTMRKFFIIGAMKAVMDRGVASTLLVDEDGVETVESTSKDEQDLEELEDQENEDNSVEDNENDFSKDEAESTRALMFNNKRNTLLQNTKGQVNTVEELLKIGMDRGFTTPDKKSKKVLKNDDANVFNSEAAEIDHDEESLDLLEEANGDEERIEEKVEILKAIGYEKYVAKDEDLTSAIMSRVDTLALNGKHTSSELSRLKRIGSKWEEIQDPYGSGRKAPELIDIKPEEILIDKTKKLVNVPVGGVLDESMLYSSLEGMNKAYTEKILHRHLLSGAVNLQRAGVCVTDYKLIRTENAFDAYEIHSFKFVPLEGDESTVKVKIPIVDEDGSFMASGVKSRMRTQRIDLPIRKISNFQVAFTSYVSKFFVSRSDKAAYSQERWMEKQLIGLSNERPDVLVNFADVFKPELKAPLKYSMLSRIVSKIEIGDYLFSFDQSKMNTLFGKDLIDEMSRAKKVQVVVGKNKKSNTILVMAADGTVFEASTEKLNDIKELGTIESILGFSIEKAPLDMIEVQGYGDLPLVFILSYYLGLGNLLETIGAKFERHLKGSRIRKLEEYEYTIRFSDEYLIFDRRDYRTQLIVAGFRQIADVIKHYSVYQFDAKEVYGSILLDLKKSARVLKNLDVIRELWIDPITRDILRKMNEPTDFVELLFSAVDKLVTDHHDLTRDERGFRQRGYERFAGFAYAEMVAAVMQHNAKPSKNNAKVEINPQAVWMKILQDKTTSPVEDSNPIHSLKESEVVVYRGAGGRDGQTLNSEARKFHPNSIGILSDATVDNGDAGAVAYTTANPNFVNLLGMTEVIDEKDRKDISPTQLLSTSSLLAPAIEFDDPKRRNFTSIQNSRTTNCVGMTLLPVRTGYENVLPYRVSKLYAYMAREDGTVTELTKNVIVIKTKTGEVIRLPLGRRSGKWQGKVVPHELITDLKLGDKFKAGTPITYNPLFFQYNWVAGTLSFKQGLLANVALIESIDTLEDSSAMSSKLTSKLDTYIVEPRDVLVNFTQEVENFVKVGQEVEYETLLCSLLDTLSTSSTAQMFTGDSREILNDIAQINPKAEYKGKVVNIEAIYVGDPEEMTESLRAIVEKCDREKSNAAKEQGKPRQDGSTTPGYRVDGTVLEANTCVLRVSIECLQNMRTGSKVVVAHQMKSVTGRVWDEDVLTESGQEVDLFFGYQSLQNRIVTSPEVLGTTNKLMIAATKAAIKAYRGN